MVGAHQNLNALRDLTMPLLGVVYWFAIRGLSLATINLPSPTKFEVCSFTHYEGIKGDSKQNVENGVVFGS